MVGLTKNTTMQIHSAELLTSSHRCADGIGSLCKMYASEQHLSLPSPPLCFHELIR